MIAIIGESYFEDAAVDSVNWQIPPKILLFFDELKVDLNYESISDIAEYFLSI
jgi:hypothetical protein